MSAQNCAQFNSPSPLYLMLNLKSVGLALEGKMEMEKSKDELEPVSHCLWLVHRGQPAEKAGPGCPEAEGRAGPAAAPGGAAAPAAL